MTKGAALAQIASELNTSVLPRVPRLLRLPRCIVLRIICTLVVFVGFAAASYLAYTGNAATSSYAVQRTRAERDAWKMRNEQLRVELAKLRSLSWVEHEAVIRLGMQKPAQLSYLKMDSALRQANSQLPVQVDSR